MNLTRLLGFFYLSAASMLPLLAIEKTPVTPTDFQPFPEVIAYASSHGIPIEGVGMTEAGKDARVGDRLVVLFTITSPNESRQWLVDLRRAPLSDREAKSKPGSGLGLFSFFLSSLKTDTGNEHGFQSHPAALESQTYGPFESKPAAAGASQPNAVAGRALASREYLAHGLATMCEIETRLHDAGKKDPGLSYMFHPRYSDEQMAGAKQRAQAAGFTIDDERVFAEGFFALVQFAQLAFKTDGVAAIIQELMDSPTLFSGAFINPDWSGLKLEVGANWSMPDLRVFRIPYNFRSKTQANGMLFVTEPHPPLQNLAGIIGLTIDWSSKTPDKRLIMRVLAGRLGTP